MKYEKVMDERQRHLHEHFSSSNYLGDPQRVQKLMAAAGLCSRRTAEEYLRQGRVVERSLRLLM